MKFYPKEQLENSRIFFDKNPPRYMTLFIVFITCFAVLCMVAATIITKTYIVECDGTVTNRDSYYLISSITGSIKQIQKKEGEYVYKGDTLLTIKDAETQDEFAKEFELKAENDGILHYYFETKPGYPVQESDVLAEINDSSKEDALIVEAKIPAKDISKVSVDQEVKIQVIGVNSQKYGLLSGTVESISSVAESTSQTTNLSYSCTIRLKSKVLKSKQDEIEIIKSMPVVAQIVYDKESYWEWIKEMVFNIAH